MPSVFPMISMAALALGVITPSEPRPQDIMNAFQSYAADCAKAPATQTIFKADIRSLVTDEAPETSPKKASRLLMQEPSKLTISYGVSAKAAAHVPLKRDFKIRLEDSFLRIVYDASPQSGAQMFTASCEAAAKL